MNDKEFKKAKKRVAVLFEKWVKRLGLGWYQVDVEYKAGDGDDRGDGYTTAMRCVSRWEYRTATITVWIEEIPDDDYKLERMVVHELMHIFAEPMRDRDVGCTDNEEYAVESLARAVLWVEEAARRDTLKKCYHGGWEYVIKESKRGKV